MAHQHTTQPDQVFRRIAVVGFGLVGASFAAAVRAAYPDTRVLAVDIDERTLAEAVERGWATDGALPDDPAFERFVGDGCDLVVLATPVGAAERYFEDLARWDYRGIVTDTASTKARITALAERVLPHPENFVPGHPMAGSEVNGIEGARPDLFKGAHWILCPDADTPAEHFPRLHELVTSIGARVIALPREDHDEAVAVVSHVPHIMASSLVQLASRHADDQQALMRLAAGGDEIRGIIGAFADALASDDRAALTALLADAAAARRALPVAWVPSTERLLEVRIPMEDRPGVVAEVTTVTSSVGCNIQSIEIDHVTEDSAVLSLVLTDEGDIGQLSAQLINAGFSVSFSPLTAKEHTHVA